MYTHNHKHKNAPCTQNHKHREAPCTCNHVQSGYLHLDEQTGEVQDHKCDSCLVSKKPDVPGQKSPTDTSGDHLAVAQAKSPTWGLANHHSLRAASGLDLRLPGQMSQGKRPPMAPQSAELLGVRTQQLSGPREQMAVASF